MSRRCGGLWSLLVLNIRQLHAAEQRALYALGVGAEQTSLQNNKQIYAYLVG